jgi:hypothetical protein
MAAIMRPDAVYDMQTGRSVPFTYNDGMVTIPNVAVDYRETRVFGIRRSDLANGIPTWWDEKVRYWKRILPSGSVQNLGSNVRMEPADPAGMRCVAIDQWKYRAATDSSTAADWQMPGFDARSWQTISNGPWNLMSDALKTYKGTVDYRFSFQEPASWTGHTVDLCLHALHVPVIYGHGVFAVNGKEAATYDFTVHDGERYNYDITSSLRPGENVISIQISSGTDFSGYGGIGGEIWLQPEPRLSEVTDLKSGWNLIGTDRHFTTPASFPGTMTGMFLSRDLSVPASYGGKNVFLHVESPNQWLALVLINGRPIYYTDYAQCYPTRVDINLAPFLKPGAVNHIELWPNRTVPRDNGLANTNQTEISLTNISIGYTRSEE